MSAQNWNSAGMTDIGLVRSENQDDLYISPDKRLFVVADGMGGAKDGALASKLAVKAAENYWHESDGEKQPSSDIADWLAGLIRSANRAVMNASDIRDTHNMMGTTIVAVYVNDDGKAFFAHVGDSRAYLIRGNTAMLLTQDHSVVWDLYRQGKLTLQQVKESQWRHIITRCLGHEQSVEADQISVDIQQGDRILLATDGLTGFVDDDVIAEIIESSASPESACRALIGEAKKHGAPDNVTVIAIECVMIDQAGATHHVKKEQSSKSSSTCRT